MHVQGDFAGAVLFSELHLSNKGFGCPDGAIYVECPKPTMVFIEVNLNETYQKSCRGKDYNSTIRGQLELKWRMTELHRSKSHRVHKSINYIIESPAFKAIYQDRDDFYRAAERQDESKLGSWRRLRIDKGVREFLQLLVPCEDRVYFCASTNESLNPFDTVSRDLLPRCGNQKWEESKRYFCWLPVSFLRDARASTPDGVTAHG